MAMRSSTRMQLARMARELPGRKMEIEYETWGHPEDLYPRQNYGGEMRMGGYGPESRGNSGGNRSGGGRGGSGGQMNYGGANSNWREDPEMRRGRRGGARSESDMDMEMGGYEAESRFRDRRGREHYDNGRFAPMRSEYRPDYDGPFGRSERGGDEVRQIGFNANWGSEMRMGSDASIPRYNEMERMPGNEAMMGGYMAEHQHRKLDEQTAMEWVRSMHNEDGSKSPHWTMDQTRQVMKQRGLDLEPVEFFAIMNALYSDYDPIFKKHGVSKIEFYADMAKAWLEDKDAVKNKAMAYYECIVK